jgi:hypothetical protein
MSHKSETRENAERVLRQQFKNTPLMSTIQEDSEDKNVGKHCETFVV